MKLTDIFLYPIKSTQAYGVAQAFVQPQGLNFDREFMLTEPNGKFITARKDGELYLFSAFPIPFGLYVQHQDGSQLIAKYQDFQQEQDCEIWGTEFASFVAPDFINQWFSEKIGREVQLRWTGLETQRRINRFPESAVSFADGYPLLLTTQASLQELQKHCPVSVKMAQFRTNLVVDGETAFDEQQWEKIQIGDVAFFNAKPCTRCILTSRDPNTHLLDKTMEPFRTLKKINVSEKGDPLFGINLIPLNSGVIKIGDQVEILSYKA